MGRLPEVESDSGIFFSFFHFILLCKIKYASRIGRRYEVSQKCFDQPVAKSVSIYICTYMYSRRRNNVPVFTP